MFKFLIFLMVMIALVAIWVTIIRPVLVEKEWAKPFFLAVEPYEIWIYKKSETILWARFKVFIGLLLTFLTQTQAIDITPLMPFVPDDWEPYVRFGWNLLPLTISFLGMIDENLRNNTTVPIEVVAIPEEKKKDPAVAAVLEAAEVTKKEAIVVAEVVDNK